MAGSGRPDAKPLWFYGCDRNQCRGERSRHCCDAEGSSANMKSNTRSQPKAGPTRRIAGRAQNDHMLDPYQARQKLQEPTVCPQCGAVYHHGRWQWGRSPEGARQDVCPACHRINDGLPAGIVTLHGSVARQRKLEIVGLARHEEAAERVEHPLNCITGIDKTADGLLFSRPAVHRRIGTPLKRASAHVRHAFR